MLAVYTQKRDGRVPRQGGVKKAAAGQLADSPRNRLADRLQLLSEYRSTLPGAPDRGNEAKVTFSIGTPGLSPIAHRYPSRHSENSRGGVPPQACSAGVPPVIVLRSPIRYRRDAGATSGARDARLLFSSFLGALKGHGWLLCYTAVVKLWACSSVGRARRSQR